MCIRDRGAQGAGGQIAFGGGGGGQRVQHQRKFAFAALRAGRQPGGQIGARYGGDFFELLGQLPAHADLPATQYR